MAVGGPRARGEEAGPRVPGRAPGAAGLPEPHVRLPQRPGPGDPCDPGRPAETFSCRDVDRVAALTLFRVVQGCLGLV